MVLGLVSQLLAVQEGVLPLAMPAVVGQGLHTGQAVPVEMHRHQTAVEVAVGVALAEAEQIPAYQVAEVEVFLRALRLLIVHQLLEALAVADLLELALRAPQQSEETVAGQTVALQDLRQQLHHLRLARTHQMVGDFAATHFWDWLAEV